MKASSIAWSISGQGSTEYPSVSSAGLLSSSCSGSSASSVSASAPLVLPPVSAPVSGQVLTRCTWAQVLHNRAHGVVAPVWVTSIVEFIEDLLPAHICSSYQVFGSRGCVYNVVSWWWDKVTGQVYRYLCLCWARSWGHGKRRKVIVIQFIWNLTVLRSLDLFFSNLRLCVNCFIAGQDLL